MERRSFIQASLATACAAAATTPVIAADRQGGPVFELRTYSLKAAKQPVLEGYLSKAFMPALKRFGIGPVGVFVEKGKEDTNHVYVLIVYPSAEPVATLSTRLAADEEYQKAAKDYLAAPATDPVYSRIESSLLVPIEGMPKLEKPDPSKPRLLNLRIYESHNERAGKKKIEMFNKGELAIFRRVGLTPVFFGETVAGAAMPNLTYLLVFPDDAAREAAWKRFRDDPEWLKLKAIPEYADKEIVSRITNKLLTPTAFSEI
ncbi:MAG: NIPSNAP family protein [Gemmataceae bacterium]|nr:NIPSNAP family protein [Gemmataceae bacterium]